MRDYTKQSFMIAAVVAGGLFLLSSIPEGQVGSVFIKQIDILSDIRRADKGSELFELVVEQVDTVEKKIDTVQITPAERIVFVNNPTITKIEDFSDGEGPSMKDFYQTLAYESQKRVVRVAMLGDSFIEGDIVSADLREQLQDIYNGCGVGFVPFASAVTQYRKTIKHYFNGWDAYTNLTTGELPNDIKGRFFISCQLAVPLPGAKTTYEGVDLYQHIKSSTTASLLFVNERKSAIHLTINDTIVQRFTPESSPLVQKICVEGSISKLSLRIDNPTGFYGYGVAFEDTLGVCVDNYSLRGNSGYTLKSTAQSINRQIDSIRGYDLIILQYGLNVLSPKVRNYDYYTTNMTKVIEELQKQFPRCAILVMGIGDRGSMLNGEFVTMPAVYDLIKAQRNIAKESHVAFWSTFDAMGGAESMATFVKKGWAAKDYTHLGYSGGKHIATSLVQAIINGKIDTLHDEIF
ncbi:MAG: hypothetical protein LBC84_03775 [Prevotellaceae bacterium]|jgi:lysophospholipase L1-like esterase|nr:hypothetical protein [Prevotellaceae bacterium]